MANTRAMQIAGIGSDTNFTEGGEILKYRNGDPTGIFVESTQGLVAAQIPPPGPGQAARMLELATREFPQR